ncbi:MAG: hypothetical protein KJO84_06685 [Acidimicrobiia bacterium]|nr:hypothetical protein [Acidimicrobiia bacterium]
MFADAFKTASNVASMIALCHTPSVPCLVMGYVMRTIRVVVSVVVFAVVAPLTFWLVSSVIGWATG